MSSARRVISIAYIVLSTVVVLLALAQSETAVLWRNYRARLAPNARAAVFSSATTGDSRSLRVPGAGDLDGNVPVAEPLVMVLWGGGLVLVGSILRRRPHS
jgi:hypothetical protein